MAIVPVNGKDPVALDWLAQTATVSDYVIAQAHALSVILSFPGPLERARSDLEHYVVGVIWVENCKPHELSVEPNKVGHARAIAHDLEPALLLEVVPVA